MIARILMTPEADSGGSVTPAKDETITPPNAHNQPPAATVQVAASEWQTMSAELGRLKQAEADRAKAERDKADNLAKEKGQWDQLVKAREAEVEARDKSIREKDAALVDLERQTANSMVSRDLAVALNVGDLIPGASNQLLKLWRDDFAAKRVGGEWVVTHRDGRTPVEFVKAQLASADYAHFVKAGSRGGSGTDATRTTETAATVVADPPKNLGDAILRFWKERNAARPEGDVSLPRGFHGQPQK